MDERSRFTRTGTLTWFESISDPTPPVSAIAGHRGRGPVWVAPIRREPLTYGRSLPKGESWGVPNEQGRRTQGTATASDAPARLTKASNTCRPLSLPKVASMQTRPASRSARKWTSIVSGRFRARQPSEPPRDGVRRTTGTAKKLSGLYPGRVCGSLH
jgi:hypothetical protein